MKVLWFLVVAALAGLALTACWPEEKAPVCGGVTDKTDHAAPKVIESKEITALNASFWMGDEESHGQRWNLSARRDSSGNTSVSIEGAMQGQFQGEHTVLDTAQDIIDRFELVKLNGVDRVTAGLPPWFSPSRLSVEYASGERLFFHMNGDPQAGWPKAMLDIFLEVFDKNR